MLSFDRVGGGWERVREGVGVGNLGLVDVLSIFWDMTKERLEYTYVTYRLNFIESFSI